MRKIGATLTLLLVLGVPFAIANIQTLYSWFPALKPALAHAVDVATGYVPPPGPSLGVKMKVWWTRDSEVGQRLHIQSRDDREFTVTDVVVNNKRECTLIDRMKGQIQNSGNSDDNKINSLVVTMARAMAPPPPWKFTLGDEHQTVYTCEPIKVDVHTDHGTVSFRFRDEDD